MADEATAWLDDYAQPATTTAPAPVAPTEAPYRQKVRSAVEGVEDWLGEFAHPVDKLNAIDKTLSEKSSIYGSIKEGLTAPGAALKGEGIFSTEYLPDETQAEHHQRMLQQPEREVAAAMNTAGLFVEAGVGGVVSKQEMGGKGAVGIVAPDVAKTVEAPVAQRVAIGLGPGEGTPLYGKGEITHEAASRIVNKAADLSGVKVLNSSFGEGSYLGEHEGAMFADVQGDASAVHDFMALAGRHAQQTEVIAMRPVEKGGAQGITLVDTSNKFATPGAADKFMEAVKEKLPKGMTIADGYQLVQNGDKIAIRLMKGDYDEAAGRVVWGGQFKNVERGAFNRAVEEVSHEQDAHIEHHTDRYNVESEYNDWKKQPNGEGYTTSLVSRGRAELEARSAVDSSLRLQENEVGQRPDVTAQPFKAVETKAPVEPYVTQDEISAQYRDAHAKMRETPEYQGLTKDLEGAKDKAHAQWKGVQDEAVKMFTTRPGGQALLDAIKGSDKDYLVKNLAMELFGDEAKKKVKFDPGFTEAPEQALNKYREDYLAKQNIPENRKFSDAANQNRAYYNSPEFQKWFKDSEVTSKEGQPLVAFHVTTKDFDEFNMALPKSAHQKGTTAYSGQLGAWFTAPSKHQGNYDVGNAEQAVIDFVSGAHYDEFKAGAQVMPVHLSIKKPMEYDSFEEMLEDRDSFKNIASYKRDLVKNGHDGIVVRNSMTDGDVDRDDWVAFKPEQVKSALGNKGAFSAESPKINEYTPSTNNPIAQAAIKGFGKTDNINEAGYMAPDGTLIDLSGKNLAVGYERQGDRNVPKHGQPDYLKDQRDIDHRELPDEVRELLSAQAPQDPRGAGTTNLMHEFMNKGNMLRLQPGIGFETSMVPTEAQIRVLEDNMLDLTHNSFYGKRGARPRPNEPSQTLNLDVIDPRNGDLIKSKEFDMTPPPTGTQLKAYIRKTLREAGVPQSEEVHVTEAQKKGYSERHAGKPLPTFPDETVPAFEYMKTAGLRVTKLEEMSSDLRDMMQNVKPIETLSHAHKVAIDSMKSAIDSIGGTEQLDSFNKYLKENVELSAAAYDPEEAAMSMITGKGRAIMTLNTRHDAVSIFDADQTAVGYSGIKARSFFDKTGDAEKALRILYEGAIQHELGHAFDAAIGERGTDYLMLGARMGNDFKNLNDFQTYLSTHVSPYAATNPHDAFAEIFTMVIQKDKVPPKLKYMETLIRGQE